MTLKAHTLRAITGFSLICSLPLLGLACSAADQGVGDAAGGTTTGSGGSVAAAGTNTAGTPSAAGSSVSSGGTPFSMGGTDTGTAGTLDMGGTWAGGISGSTAMGGVASGGQPSAGAASGGNQGMGGKGGPSSSYGGDLDGPVAYGITIAPNGSWMGIQDPDKEIAALIASGAKYVRFSRADPSPDNVGIPDATNAKYAQQMTKAGLKLGCVILAPNGDSAAELIAQGKKLKDSGFYDWIFVDGALTRKDIQDIMDGLTAAGWDKIMENDTLFGSPNAVVDPPKGVWGHAKAFGAVHNPDGPAVTDGDIKFIDYIHKTFPESHALLKLEIDSEVQIFMKFSTATQLKLLTGWDKAQPVNGFSMIYPLFMTDYDSQQAGTYDTQVNLMKTK